MKKSTVVILFGGRSVEHAVSVNSARNIYQFMDRNRFEPVAIGITTDGRWFLLPEVTKEIESGEPVSLKLDAREPAFVSASGKVIRPDVVFPIVHGTDGEDGGIQGILKVVDVPCVGSGVTGSAVCINKHLAKKLMAAAGLPIPAYLAATPVTRDAFTFEVVKKALGLPFMVKSASLGSSVGVTKVKTEADFDPALDDAFRYDTEVIFEQYVQGREVECAVLGNGSPETSTPGEIVISKQYEFYTFDAKYVDPDAVRIQIPAEISATTAEQVRELAARAFEVLYCLDYARVDMFVTSGGSIYINEINTIPGFTNSSMYPMMWKQHGVSFTDLISRLIHIAHARHAEGQRQQRSYQSNLRY
ncbi:MAG: D-alanine--D-alanine ligase [Cyclobacteriaceae bacterium]|nr:D-alanine--D-alanine ligase [Cyclobacteriaceae bacterium]